MDVSTAPTDEGKSWATRDAELLSAIAGLATTGTLKSLVLNRSLCLSDKVMLSTFVRAVGRMRDLTRLSIDSTRMITVPDELCRLPLTELSIRDNLLRVLPTDLALMGTLVELEVRCNFLSTLPEAIGELKVLRLLSAGRNSLRALPGSIGRCTALKTLWLEHNKLTTLPEQLGVLHGECPAFTPAS